MRTRGYALCLFLAVLLVVLAAPGAEAAEPSTLSDEEAEVLLQEAIRYATITWQIGDETHVGVPYLWGGRMTLSEFLAALEEGRDPAELGVDASGLLIGALHGVSPNLRFRVPAGDGYRTTWNVNSSMLYAHNIIPVAVEDLRPGDLIFFGSDGRIDGVAIYERTVGRNIRFVVASASAGKVVQTGANLDGEYWATRFAGAGRLLRIEE